MNTFSYWFKIVQFTVFTALILYFGQTLFVPLSFALLISFILYPACLWLERKRISRGIAIGLCLIVFSLLVGLLLGLLIQQFTNFTKQLPALGEKVSLQLDQLGIRLDRLLGMDVEERKNWIKVLLTEASQRIVQQLPQTLYATSISAVLVLLVPIYAALILYYRDLLVRFVYQIVPVTWKEDIKVVLPEVVHTYFDFIKGMAIVYLVVGILNSIGLLILGIPQAIFFGFIASILTFIPYVGITVGALLPMAIAWLTYDSIIYPVGVVIVFVVVQILEANLIFPAAVSYKLSINMLATLVIIVVGGMLWGAAGMILFIPFIAILKLIAERIEDLHPMALLLGTHDEIHKLYKKNKS